MDEPGGSDDPLEDRLRATLAAVVALDERPARPDGPERAYADPQPVAAAGERRPPSRALVAAAAVALLVLGAVAVIAQRDRSAAGSIGASSGPVGTSAAGPVDADGYAYLVPAGGLGPNVTFWGMSKQQLRDGPIAGSNLELRPYLRGVAVGTSTGLREYLVKLTPGPWNVTTIGYSDGPDVNGIITIVSGARWSPDAVRFTSSATKTEDVPPHPSNVWVDPVDPDSAWTRGRPAAGATGVGTATGFRFTQLGQACMDAAQANFQPCVSDLVGGNDDVVVLITANSTVGSHFDPMALATGLRPVTAATWAGLSASAGDQPVRPEPSPAAATAVTIDPAVLKGLETTPTTPDDAVAARRIFQSFVLTRRP
jgi:hypothetical protein